MNGVIVAVLTKTLSPSDMIQLGILLTSAGRAAQEKQATIDNALSAIREALQDLA